MTTTIRGTDNSAAAPALTGNDSDTGVYFPAANKLGLVTGGTERVIVDDSGNVGVGTGTPAVALDVVGQVRASTGILFGSDTAAANALDDYEEGTWTPTQGAGLTVVGAFSSVGKYTKVGNVVTITGFVGGATSVAIAAAATVICAGVPFSVGSPYGVGGAVSSNTNDGMATFVLSTSIYATETMSASSAIYFSATYLI